ncbi:MAG: hypothetical protein PHV23_00805 [Candidatus Gracilibacteria bacterium]|nr:hypothetical protein [Candidatus Gracilibacteria bacterium]
MSKIEIILAIFNLILIGVIGYFQIKINNNLHKLQKSVAINIEPNIDSLKLVNVGKINLYIHKFETYGNNHKFTKPRLIAIKSFYWIPAPDLSNFNDKESEIKVYIEDEFNEKYILTGFIVKDLGSVYTTKLEKRKWEY